MGSPGVSHVGETYNLTTDPPASLGLPPL